MKLKIEFEIEVEDGLWFDPELPEEVAWFMDILNDKENTLAILHSNEFGDTIGSTSNFKIKII